MLRIVTPPASYPITLDEAKAQLRVSGTGNDAMIELLIPAATKFCQSLVQRVFIAQTLEWVLPCWRDCLDIPIAPVLASDIASIKFVDWASEAQLTLDPSLYVVQTAGSSVRIVAKRGAVWPLVLSRSPEPIVIRFDAGYDDPADLPGNVKAAILLMLRHLYTAGEVNLTVSSETSFGIGQKQYSVPADLMRLIPDAVRDLMLDEVW